MPKHRYRIIATIEVNGVIEIEAETAEEAYDLAEDTAGDNYVLDLQSAGVSGGIQLVAVDGLEPSEDDIQYFEDREEA